MRVIWSMSLLLFASMPIASIMNFLSILIPLPLASEMRFDMSIASEMDGCWCRS